MAKGTFNLSNIQVGGRVGDLLFLPQPNGRLVVRRMPTELPPRTALQDEAARRMRIVGDAWQALSDGEAAAWAAYVREAREWPLPPGGKAPTQAYGAFLGLASKVLQMRPEGPVPSLPPATPFLGDGISVECGAASGESGVSFQANGPNSPGVATELLLQPLAGRHRKPTPKGYRTRAFVAFGNGPVAVACPPGPYACAIRFIRSATGQETAIIPIGKVVVPG